MSGEESRSFRCKRGCPCGNTEENICKIWVWDGAVLYAKFLDMIWAFGFSDEEGELSVEGKEGEIIFRSYGEGMG